MTIVTVNGNTYSDDGSTSKDMQNGGFRSYLLPMVSDTMTDTAAKVAAAAASAAAAAVSASTAVSGPGSNGTSTTSLTVALGTQSLTIQTAKTISPGMPITIASTASPKNWMNGSCDSYNSGTGALQVNVTNIGLVTPGVYPTLSAWTVSLSGPAGFTGVLNEMEGAPIASAATINLDSATGNFVHISGNTGPVTTVTLAQGAERVVVLDSNPSFTNSANLICVTGANVQGAAGDVITFRGEGAGVTRMVDYVPADGRLLPGAAATTAQVKGGAVADKVLTPANMLAACGFAAFFQTTDQTITDAGALTIAHGLGRVPMFLQGFLKNVTAELNYSVGDITPVGIGADSGSAPKGVAITADATNIYVRFSNGGGSANTFYVCDKTSGAVSIITNAKWSFFVRVLV